MTWSIQLRDGVAIVRMRSNSVNKQNYEFFADLQEAFDRLERDFRMAPVVLTGEEQVFSVGIDFEQSFPLFARADADEIATWFNHFRASILRVFTYPRPTVAAVNGHAFAGGLILALACDFRIALTGDYRCGLNEVAVGIAMPSVYTELIRHRVGPRAASDSILTGTVYSNDGGKDMGFYQDLVEPDSLLSASVTQACCVPTDCLQAYAHSKEMLLYPVLKVIQDESERLDRKTAQVVCSSSSIAAQTRALKTLRERSNSS